jgi:hypothetical protein
MNNKQLKKMWSVHVPRTASEYEDTRQLHPPLTLNEKEDLIMHVHSSAVEHVLQNGVTSRSFSRHFWGGHGAFLSESFDSNIEVEKGNFRFQYVANAIQMASLTHVPQTTVAMLLFAKRFSVAN